MYCGGGDDTRWPSEVLPASQFAVEHYNTLYPALFSLPRSLSCFLSPSREGEMDFRYFEKGEIKEEEEGVLLLPEEVVNSRWGIQTANDGRKFSLFKFVTSFPCWVPLSQRNGLSVMRK